MPRIPYKHPFLSFSALTQHLVELGMNGDKDDITQRLMDVGSLVFLYQHVKPSIQKKVSRSFHLPAPDILLSWLRSLNDVRNACAHHNRVWNRTWVKTPSLPKNEANWYCTYDETTGEWIPSDTKVCSFNMSKTGGILTVCRRLMQDVASTSRWKEDRLFPLFKQPRFGCVPPHWLGLPNSWMTHPLWR